MNNEVNGMKQEQQEPIERAETDTTTEVTLWLDSDVVDKFKSSGDGWQTRINDALKSWVQTHA